MGRKAAQIHEEIETEATAEELEAIKKAEAEAEADRIAKENAEELERLEAEEIEKKEAEKKAQAEAKELESKPKKQLPKAKEFPLEQYYREEEYEEDVSDNPEFPRYEIKKRHVLRAQYQKSTHRIKCRIRAAKHYGVHIDHLQSAYKQLNGKKIDGMFINHLIDRFGFSNGKQMNRIDTAKLAGLPVEALEVADEKLKAIVQSMDVLGQYKEYLRTFTAEAKHDIERDSYNV